MLRSKATERSLKEVHRFRGGHFLVYQNKVTSKKKVFSIFGMATSLCYCEEIEQYLAQGGHLLMFFRGAWCSRFPIKAITVHKPIPILIYPNLLYGITCWGSCSKAASQPIQIIQNRILRCINMIGLRQIYVSELYILSNVLKVHDMYEYVLELCKFMFR